MISNLYHVAMVNITCMLWENMNLTVNLILHAWDKLTHDMHSFNYNVTHEQATLVGYVMLCIRHKMAGGIVTVCISQQPACFNTIQ